MQHDSKTEAQTTLRLPRELWDGIRRLALDRRTSATKLTIEGLELVLKKYSGDEANREAA